jgi:GNAT superfamily N-acetyltransferase
MAEFTIRKATSADAPEILRQRILMMTDMGMGTEESRSIIQEPTLHFLSRTLQDGIYHGWLAENEKGEPVAGGGILFVDWPPSAIDLKDRRPYIINMYTDPAYRRRGLAQRILGHLLAYLQTEGYATARLNASKDGRPVYERLGFHESNEMVLPLDRLL